MNPHRPAQNGVMLLESLVAVLVVAFGVLGLVSLWAGSIKDDSEAKYRIDASLLANEMIGQMWLDRANLTTSYSAPTQWTNRVAATLPSGTGSIVVEVDPNVTPQLRATITVQWKQPGAARHTFVSVAQINGAGTM